MSPSHRTSDAADRPTPARATYGGMPRDPGGRDVNARSRRPVAFRTDKSGRSVQIRPRQLLVDVEPTVGESVDAAVERFIGTLEATLRTFLAPSSRDAAAKQDGPILVQRWVKTDDEGERPALVRVSGPWQRVEFETGAPDVLDIVSRLRAAGVRAQPNHAYVTSTLSAAGALRAAPNMFTPNMFTPNMFTPNMFTPNMFTPNMFTPNMFTGGAGAGGCCCADCGAVPGLELDDPEVPPHGARPAKARDALPKRQLDAGVDRSSVQIHVLDVVSMSTQSGAATLVGEYGPGEFAETPFPPGATPIQHARDELADFPELRLDDNTDKWIDPAAGHGDFVKDVAARASGGISVKLWQAADPIGVIDDEHLVKALEVIAASAPFGTAQRVLNLSVAGYNDDDRPSDILADQIAAMIDDGWLVVAAAGNNTSCRPTYPAALPGVVAVGALGTCAPAWFTNFGPWVDVSAPGVDIVAKFPIGKLRDHLEKSGTRSPDELIVGYEADPDDPSNPTKVRVITAADFTADYARWSGTSFAAPIVAGRLAAALATDDFAGATTSRDAAKQAIERAVRTVFDNDHTDLTPLHGRLLCGGHDAGT